QFGFARPNALFAVTRGALPPGLKLSKNGIISGNPKRVGLSTFTVTASTPAAVIPAESSSRNFTMKVLPAFLGFSAPHPRATERDSPHTIRVIFRLGAYGGDLIGSSISRALAAEVTLPASGRKAPLATAHCSYYARGKTYICHLRQPHLPAYTTKRRFYITAYVRF